jgi:hypothetical protein
MLKFKRQAPGHYVAGNVEIKKGVGIDQDKWFCYFPDDKVSYRRSYEAAKVWSEKYMEKLQTYKVAVNQVKTVKEQATTSKEQSLQHKLSRHLSYVVGAESLGCVNTGRAACIAHLSVNGKSFYVVGLKVLLPTPFSRELSLKLKKIYNLVYSKIAIRPKYGVAFQFLKVSKKPKKPIAKWMTKQENRTRKIVKQ